MSLINKMLQDLDARGGENAGPAFDHAQIRPVSMASRVGAGLRERLPMLLLGAGLLVAVAAALTWQYLVKPRMAAAPAARPAASKPIAAAPAPSAADLAALKSADAVKQAIRQAGPDAAPEQAFPPSETQAAASTPLTGPLDHAPGMKLSQHLSTARPAARAKAQSAPSRPVQAAKARPPAPMPRPGETGTPAQRAEAEYRQATAFLQQGRVTDAIAALEQAVLIDPTHQPARQTLISLLMEQNRTADAMRHLRASLALDAAQPELAMLLAKLSLEANDLRGALVTLYRSAPSAAGRPDYQAYLAGVLARDKRHKEAAERYMAALRLNPQNGVWWMGLGIALQADNRPREAQEAYLRARQTNTLSPELQGYVEQKIVQLR